MATKQFKDISPYKRTIGTPSEDYLYSKYETDLAAKVTTSVNVTNVAIFGIGRAGTIHLSSLARNPRAQILYIVDDIVEKHKRLQDYWSLHDTKFLTSKESDVIFSDPKVHAVVVATPTFAHEHIVKSALNAKKAVFCEKPLAQERNVCIELYKLSKEVGKPLLTAFNRRFDPSFSNIRDRVHKGEVGHVQTIKCCNRDSPIPSFGYIKTSVGIYHDCCIHDIDTLCWVLGEFPTKVSSMGYTHVEELKAIDDFDTVSVTLLYPSGTIGMIELSRNSCYGYDQRLEVFGPRGMIRADNEQPIHCIDSQIGLTGIKTAPIWYSYPSRYHVAYQAEMEHFFDLVEGKANEPFIKGHEILAVNKIAAAAEESARTGKFIDLTWTKDDFEI
ncbi:uncharacterized oxidoreductase YrbE-like [Chrysoperla carnea]|uniref:uncharacterized oxidoreductase YrbE-like n=1 Tax=Chrysoperla carnea TaxID=189513 RepID=UPI001D08FCE0|nr:uncharacterized oxidoreductase YrbE-like [Chrysoperla carnea]